ncbi:MAG: WYL domain-containing protein [Chloroflexota bacterium]|nr:WYL domain-containing protein [Chloroflexota bacterium]
MSIKRNTSKDFVAEMVDDQPDKTEGVVASDGLETRLEPLYENVRRILRLLFLLNGGDCVREDIFVRMKDDYRVGEHDTPKVLAPSGRAGKMLTRDLRALQDMGYEIKASGKGQATRYSLIKGSGPFNPFLFSQVEVDTFILLHTLFSDPARYVPVNDPLPVPTAHNPFAQQIVALVERLAATLPEKQRRHFERWVRKPFVYMNMDTITDYLPHRETIEEIVKAISLRQQIRFEYASMERQQGVMLHEDIDPYYIFHQDGHLYLSAYSHGTSTFLEYRIDRIKEASVKLQPRMIDGERRRHPIEFSFWLDSRLVKSGLSQRWLSQTIEREEAYLDTQGKPRRRVLVRATAYSDWRILQQIHKYGDKAELIDPPELREKMRQEVERIFKLYHRD